MNSLFEQIARWPRVVQIVVILCGCVSLDLALLTLLWLVITSPTAGAGAIMSIMSVIQLSLSLVDAIPPGARSRDFPNHPERAKHRVHITDPVKRHPALHLRREGISSRTQVAPRPIAIRLAIVLSYV